MPSFWSVSNIKILTKPSMTTEIQLKFDFLFHILLHIYLRKNAQISQKDFTGKFKYYIMEKWNQILFVFILTTLIIIKKDIFFNFIEITVSLFLYILILNLYKI